MTTTWRTRLIHSKAAAPSGFRSLVTPVYRGSTTVFPRASAIVDTWNHDEVPYTYGLYGTPTTLELAGRVAELEGGHRCFIAPGGQAALALVYFSYLHAGDHVLVPESALLPRPHNLEAGLHGIDWSLFGRVSIAGDTSPTACVHGSTHAFPPWVQLGWCDQPGDDS